MATATPHLANILPPYSTNDNGIRSISNFTAKHTIFQYILPRIVIYFQPSSLLLNLSCVSKEWYSIIVSRVYLALPIEGRTQFSNFLNQLENGQAIQWGSQIQGLHLKNLDSNQCISGYRGESKHMVEFSWLSLILCQCPNLKRLSFKRVNLLCSEVIQVTKKLVFPLTTPCPSTSSSSDPSAKLNKGSSNQNLSDGSKTKDLELLDTIPSLTHLIINDGRDLSPSALHSFLKFFHVLDGRMEGLPQGCITNLSLVDCPGLSDTLLKSILDNNPFLETLSLKGNSFVTGSTLFNVLLPSVKQSCLCHLSLSNCVRLGDNSLEPFLHGATTLKSLNISNCIGITRLQPTMPWANSLHILNVAGCRISAFDLTEFILSLPKLGEITLRYDDNGCHGSLQMDLQKLKKKKCLIDTIVVKVVQGPNPYGGIPLMVVHDLKNICRKLKIVYGSGADAGGWLRYDRISQVTEESEECMVTILDEESKIPGVQCVRKTKSLRDW
jgi:hypothetical protein